MAILLARTLITKSNPNFLPSIFNRAVSSLSSSSSSPLVRLRPLLLLAGLRRVDSTKCLAGSRSFSTRPTTSSLNDPSPNWNNRPPKETILLEGCDFEHWLIVLEKPEEGKTRDEIIDSYIKTAAQVIGSEEEARMKIYSVSTKHYFAFGVIVSEEESYKFKDLTGVRWVLPDSYLDVRNKDYGGEPFINGEAVPYDPKYHEDWVRNNARANERSRRNDRPRNFDRSRNFERRRENTQGGNYGNPGSNAGGGPPPNVQNSSPNMGGGPPNVNVQSNAPSYQGMPPNPNMQNTPPNYGAPPHQNMQNNAPNYGVMPPNQHNGPNYGPPNPNVQNNGPYMPPNPNMQNNRPNYGVMPPRGPGANAGFSNVNPGQNNGGFSPRDGVSNPGYSNNSGPNAVYGNNSSANMQNRDSQYAPTNGGMPYQNGPGPIPNRDYQNSYVPPPPPSQSGNAGNAYQVVRDIPGRDN